MKINAFMAGFTAKASVFTLVLMLSSVSLTNYGCGIKLPPKVTEIFGTLSSALPSLMSQAGNLFGSSQASQASNILSMLGEAASLTAGGKTQGISDMFSALGKNQIEPFIEKWKRMGKLDASTIATATQGVTGALDAIKKKAKIK